MNYHTLDSIKDIHVEITNRCNAACPMCARNYYGGSTKENLLEDEWSITDIEKIFNKKIKNLQNVMFCGTHGDPIVAKNLLTSIEQIRSNFNTTIEVYTNGSLRKSDFWTELGKTLQKKKPNNNHYRKNDLVIFSIDGLSDTNHLYRRHTNFEKIIENANTFIKNGGIARWDFIVFKHNEHQVEDAKILAEKLGFKQFRIRKTSRFDYSPDGQSKWRVQNKDNKIEYYLEPPSKQEFKNDQSLDDVIKKYGSFKKYMDKSTINCLYKNKFNRIYVNAYAQVFPCCYISNDIYPAKNLITYDTINKVINKYKTNFNSLRYNEWEEILEHPWFSHELTQSWSKNLDEGKLMRCARTCGTEYKPITSQSFDTTF